LVLGAAALHKPICHSLPLEIRGKLQPEPTDSDETELLTQFRKIAGGRLRELAIRQVKLLADKEIQEHLDAEYEELQRIRRDR
jgi:hypothetical protein